MIHISGYALFPNIKNNHRRLSTLLINYIIFLTYLYIWNITIFPVPAIAFRFFTASAIVPWICPKSIRQSAAGKSQENRTEVFWSRIVGLFNSWLPAAGLNRFGPWGNPIQVCGQHRMVGFVGGLHNNALQCSEPMAYDSHIGSRFVVASIRFVCLACEWVCRFCFRCRFAVLFAKWLVIKSMRMFCFISLLL